MKATPIRMHPSTLALAVAAALPLLAAAPGSSSPYRADAQSTHVEDATSQGVAQVNMITCIMSALRPDALVNKGAYNALVDQKKCDAEQRSSSDNAGADSGAANAPSYMNGTVVSTRAANDQPMRAKAWLDQKGKDDSATISVNISATESPSANNPYGVFRLDYCGKGETGPCRMNGFLQGSSTGISYFEIEGDSGNTNVHALRLTTSGTDSGAGLLHMAEQGQTLDYAFAYNASLFRRSDGVQDQCFSRDASDPETGMSVWRYGLYDATSGERITRMSGFPIDYTDSHGTVTHGQMGYWGLWMPPDVTVPGGATVQRVQYNDGQSPTKTDYTLVKAGGRLTKYTKQTRTLASLDKLPFQVFVNDATGLYGGAASNRQYEMYWDNAAGAFKVTGTVDCDNGPCQTHALDTERSVAPAFFAAQGGARGFSQSLGGELFIPLAGVSGAVQAASINVIYRVQDLVYPADMPATLYCMNQCPTAATIASYFGPGAASPFVPATYNTWGPKDSSGIVAYTADSSAALLKDAANGDVVFTDADAAQSHPQYQSGVRTGRLVTSLAAAQCADNPGHYCDWQMEQADVYYQWETGPNQWSQFAALKDSHGAVVSFDPPLQVSYQVPAGAAYGDYAGKSIVLQYGGFGELWGIPGHCVSALTNAEVTCDNANSRYVPAFVIPFDETVGRVDNGGTPLLVKWLDREIRFAKKNPAVCSSAGLSLPSGLVLPTSAGLQDPTDPASSIYVGTRPAVNEPPRVIQGDVKF